MWASVFSLGVPERELAGRISLTLRLIEAVGLRVSEAAEVRPEK